MGVNWRRLYWCTYDGWTGGWHARAVKHENERLMMERAKFGIGWRAPMYIDGVKVKDA